MANETYALIKNNNVVNIIVFDNPSSDLINQFKEFHDVDLIIKDNNKASIGGTYDGSKFWPLQPYPSWIKDEELNEWISPVEKPEFDLKNPILYIWNEEILNWEEVSE